MAGDEQAERDDQVRLSEDERLLRSYRYARTYPKTLRKLGGIELPWPVTVTQLAVWIAAFALLWYSLPVWGHLGSVTPLLLVAVPTGLAVAVHHLRLEGRSPLAMATGLASLLAAPRGGVLHGRPLRQPRPVRYGGMFFVSQPPRPAPEPPRRPEPAAAPPRTPNRHGRVWPSRGKG